MHDDFEDLLRYRACRSIDGRIQRVNIARRNGLPVVLFAPTWADDVSTPVASGDWQEEPKYYLNLNPVERRTWRKILRAQSIGSIAKEEGVSRAAIYARIQGNAKGQGGMIGKNFWVLLWWRLRQRQMRGPI